MSTTKYIIELDDEPKKSETGDVCYDVVGFKGFNIAQCTKDKLREYVPPIRTAGYDQGLKDAWDAYLTLYGDPPLCKRLFGDKPFYIAISESNPREIIKKIKQAEQAKTAEKQKLFKMFQYVVDYEDEWDTIHDLLNEVIKDINGTTYEEIYGG